jgi:hypothetical protein
MTVRRTYGRLAEAPPNEPTHPAIVERITKDMKATAAVLDIADAESMSADEPWKAIQQLRTSVEALFVEVEGYRPEMAQTYKARQAK